MPLFPQFATSRKTPKSIARRTKCSWSVSPRSLRFRPSPQAPPPLLTCLPGFPDGPAGRWGPTFILRVFGHVASQGTRYRIARRRVDRQSGRLRNVSRSAALSIEAAEPRYRRHAGVRLLRLQRLPGKRRAGVLRVGARSDWQRRGLSDGRRLIAGDCQRQNAAPVMRRGHGSTGYRSRTRDERLAAV